MTNYRLSIVTPGGKVFEDEVESLVAAGASGSFGILAGHAPMVAALTNGPLKVRQEGRENYFAVSSGILEVTRQSGVLLLTDHAVKAESLNGAKEAVKNFKSMP